MKNNIAIRYLLNNAILTMACSLIVGFPTFAASHAAPQETITLHPFTTGQRMPTNQVRQVYEDREGIMWFATFRGLAKHADGRLRIYRTNLFTPDLLPCNNVICVCEDTRQRLWIGTENGLCRLDKNTGRMVHITAGNRKIQRVNQLLVTRNGKVYAGTIRGLWQYDEHAKHMTKAGLDDVNIQSLAELSDNGILIGTWKKGMFIHSPAGDVKPVPLSNEIASKTVLAIHQDNKSRIWIGTLKEGLCQIKADNKGIWQITTQYAGSNIPSDCVYSIAEKDGKLLAGTRKGLFVEKGETLLKGVEILGTCVDSHRDVWIATKGCGIYTTSDKSLYKGKTEEDMPAAQVLTDKDNGRWEALNYGVKYTPASSTKAVVLLPDRRPYLLSITSNGRVLIPMHDDGLYVAWQGQIEKHLSRFHDSSFIPHDLIHHAMEDSHGNLWVAIRHGIGIRYKNGKDCILHQQPNAPAYLSEETYFLAEDSEGTVWAATNEGMIRCDSTYRHYSLEKGNFPIGHPTAFCQDRAGRRWVGTDGMGLCMYDSRQDCFRSVHERLQLPGDLVTGLFADEDSSLTVDTGTETIRLSNQELVRLHREKSADTFQGFRWMLPGIGAILIACAAWLLLVRRKKNGRTQAPLLQTIVQEDQPVADQRHLFVDNATAIVMRHLNDCGFDVPQLASELSISRSTLHRYMKEMTGKTTTAFIRDIRMQEAYRILSANKDIRISDLAYRVGFNDPKYFSRCFKDMFGVLPSDYSTGNHVAK